VEWISTSTTANRVIGRIGHRPAHRLSRRLLNTLRSWFVGGVRKSQAVYFVDINGHRYKRVVFGDSRQAEDVEAALRAVSFRQAFPRLVERHENEIWVEFIPGRRLSLGNAADLAQLAHFFGRLYAQEPRSCPLTETPWHDQLHTDLWFLGNSGVLPPRRAAAIAEHADAIRPHTVWQGFDYVDPVAKNFVIADGELRAIDVESLQPGSLLATGIAKCRVHAPEFDVERFLGEVIDAGAPDIRAQYAYTELCFLAGWTKRKLLAGKRHYVQAERFQSY